VSSEDTFISTDGAGVGEGTCVRYEMWLRRLEASVHSLVGLSGSFFVARRRVLQRWEDSIPRDFATAINTVRAGLVVISDPWVRGMAALAHPRSPEPFSLRLVRLPGF
jgi:hypothetical protein